MATKKTSSNSSSKKKTTTSKSTSKTSTSKKKATVKDEGIVGVLGEELIGAAIGKAKVSFLGEVEEKTSEVRDAILTGKGFDGIKEVFVHEEKQASTHSSKSASSELRELKKLLEDGVITQKDFDAKKKKLLEI